MFFFIVRTICNWHHSYSFILKYWMYCKHYFKNIIHIHFILRCLFVISCCRLQGIPVCCEQARCIKSLDKTTTRRLLKYVRIASSLLINKWNICICIGNKCFLITSDMFTLRICVSLFGVEECLKSSFLPTSKWKAGWESPLGSFSFSPPY